VADSFSDEPEILVTEREDVFICHASEDKDEVALPLVTQLNTLRVTTWYDDHALQVGDSLREKIDEGLNRAKYGLVILSPAFFAKQWPKEELDGMFTRRTSDGAYAILPVWHNVTQGDVAKFSPMLAGKVGLNTADGLQLVAARIREVVHTSPAPTDPASYARHHRDATIRVTDLPLAYGWIDNHYFYNCHLVGPAVLALNDLVYMDRPGFPSVEAFFPIQVHRNYSGMIGVRRTAFVNCVFENIGVAVDSRHYDELLRTAGAGSRFVIDESPLSPPPADGNG